MYKIINAIACKFRQLLHKHHINTLQAYWTGIQRYEEYRQCRYEPEGRLRVHTYGHFATQKVRDNETMEIYVIYIPMSDYYQKIDKLYKKVVTITAQEYFIHSEMFSGIGTWLEDIESQYNYNFAEPYLTNNTTTA